MGRTAALQTLGTADALSHGGHGRRREFPGEHPSRSTWSPNSESGCVEIEGVSSQASASAPLSGGDADHLTLRVRCRIRR